MTRIYCANCHNKPVENSGDWCKACRFSAQVSQMLDEDPEYRDWEFAICEECGSSLGSDGECRNTSCGASPDLGKDWI